MPASILGREQAGRDCCPDTLEGFLPKPLGAASSSCQLIPSAAIQGGGGCWLGSTVDSLSPQLNCGMQQLSVKSFNNSQ